MRHSIDDLPALPPSLPRQQQIDYFKLYKEGHSEYKELLITHNLRLVRYIARKFSSTKEEYDEYFAIGSVGLIKAVEGFNCDKNNNFASYSVRCIENEILMAIRREKKHSKNTSMQEVVKIDNDGNELLLEDILFSSFDLEEMIIENEQLSMVASAIMGLPEFERTVILMRYFIGGHGLDQYRVAAYLGLSQSAISRAEKRILKKLKTNFRLQEHPAILTIIKKQKQKYLS